VAGEAAAVLEGERAAAPEQVAEQGLAPEAEQVRERVAQRALALVHPVLAGDMDMAARMVPATAVRYRPRRRGTRCRPHSRAPKPAAGITAHQASARGMRCKRRFRILKPAAPIAERRVSPQVDKPAATRSPGHWPGASG
jgi:hypothetical protein